MINTSIGKYKISKLIGEGGMASVYEAEHEMLGTKVAIKVLNPILSANAEIKTRFRNEAKLMASLDHPNITKVIDFDEKPQQLSIVMEFLNGEDLDQKIKRNGPLSEKEISDIFSQTLSAFQYAHEKGIVHRDIKPSNIYILSNGHVKILDFGIAKLFGQGNEMTQTGTQMGTPIYMSPEQVKGDKSIDHRSDIYSLGVTMFFAINGKPPYNSTTESQFDIFNKIVYEPLPELLKTSSLSGIVSRACNKDRRLRFQSCGDYLEALKLPSVIPADSNDKTVVDNNNSGITKEEKTVIDDLGKNYTEREQKKNNELQTSSKAKMKLKLLISTLVLFGVTVISFLIYQFNSNTNKSNETLTTSSDNNSSATQNKNTKHGENTVNIVDSSKNKNSKQEKNNVNTLVEEELNFNGLPFYKTSIKINPNPRGGSQNVFFNQNYTLFDLTRPYDPIFPVNKNGKIVYQIYYSSNEDPKPYYGEFTPSQLESHLYYKFKNKETCQEFCRNKKTIIWQGQNGKGLNCIFKKTSSNEWVENDENGSFYFNEIKNENGNYTLKDKNRAGVYIYLSADKAYYKDNNNSEWQYIFYGRFK